MKIVSYDTKITDEYESRIEKRFAIADDDGKIIDDAQGFGYKTGQNAHKAMWYKFNGGKKKIQTRKKKRRALFKKHPGLEDFIESLYMDNCKEICRVETTEEDLLEAIKEKFNIDMPKECLHD